MTVELTIPVGELTERSETWNPSRSPNETFDYIDLSAIDQETKEIVGAREIPRNEAPSRARQLVRKGDILVSTVRPNLNGVARVPEQLDGATASTGFCVLRPRPDLLDGGYLFHWVKTPDFVTDMVRKATGASYPAISDRIILDSKLPIPPLEEQRRIAEVLDRAEELRAKRRAALAQLDTLTQSIFLDLFGYPLTNPMGWPSMNLKSLGKVKTGGTPPSSRPHMFGGSIPFVTPGDLESFEPVKRTVTEEGAALAETAREGSAFVCCIGATIGKMGKATQRSAFNQQINAVEWATGIDDDYGIGALRFFKNLIKTRGASTTLPILKKSSFEKIEIPVPPITLQRSFASRVAAVERLRATLHASGAELDALFASLQHRAFRGEL